MRDLVKLVDLCFQSGGPFVASINGGSYRKDQHVMAVDLAKFLTMESPDMQFEDGSPNERPPMMLNEVATGSGKTLVYLTVMAIKYAMLGPDGERAYPDSKGIVSTYTRHLRKEIISEIPTILAVLRRMAKDGHPVNPSIDIAPFISASSLFCKAKIAQDGQDDFIAWAETRYAECARFYDAFCEDGDLDKAMKAPFPVMGEYEGPFPDDMPQDMFAMTDQKTPDSDVEKTISLLGALNSKAKSKSQIMVVTHAMLLINSIRFGAVLSTERDPDDQTRFDVVVDEADRYKDQAIGMFTFDVNLTKAVNHLLAWNKGRSKAAKQARETISSARDALIGMGAITDINQYAAIMEMMEGSLPDLIKDFRKNSPDPQAAAQVNDLHQTLKTLAAYMRDITRQTGLQKNAFMHHEILQRDGDTHLIGYPTEHGYLASRLWSSTQTMAIGRVALYSGSITGVSKSSSQTCIKTFSSLSGIWRYVPLYDGATDTVRTLATPKLSTRILPSNRHIGGLVISEQSDMPRYNRDGSLYQQYWDRVADILDRDLDQTTLVLFQSYKAHDYIAEKLAHRNDVVLHGPNSIDDAAGRERRGEKSIILTVNWRGTNYVHDRKTFVKRIVIPALPVPRSNDGRPDLCSTKQTFMQGLGRAIRHDGDEFELWVCDPRFRPTRCGGKWTDPYSHLADSIFTGSLGEKLTTYLEISQAGEISPTGKSIAM